MNFPDELPRMDRRRAIKWMLTATASLTVMGTSTHGAGAKSAHPAASVGYGPDPDLLKNYAPGDIWPLTLTPEQRRTVAALSDIIIPSDPQSPSASAVGITDFIDEWVSSPYPDQALDREILLAGLAWIDAKAKTTGGELFFDSQPQLQQKLCRELAVAAKAEDPAQPAQFFRRFRDLVAGGYYTSPAGMKDIGYVGNKPLLTYPEPTPDALRHLGLA